MGYHPTGEALIHNHSTLAFQVPRKKYILRLRLLRPLLIQVRDLQSLLFKLKVRYFASSSESVRWNRPLSNRALHSVS